jgi:hypothetical protein
MQHGMLHKPSPSNAASISFHAHAASAAQFPSADGVIFSGYVSA